MNYYLEHGRFPEEGQSSEEEYPRRTPSRNASRRDDGGNIY